MIFILLLLLSFLMFFSFYSGARDLMSPWFISCVMYTIGVLFVILNGDNWVMEISAITLIVIVTALMSFGLGEIVVTSAFGCRNRFKMIRGYEKRIRINILTNIAVFVFSLLALFLYYKRINEIAIQAGYIEGVNSFLQYVRLGIIQKGLSIGPVVAIASFILRSLSYVYTFVYLYNKLLLRKGKLAGEWYLLFPSLCYLIMYSLSGSRGGLIEYVSYVVILSSIFISKSPNSFSRNNLKIAKFAVLGLGGFILLFLYVGSLKGWSLSDIRSMLSFYGGGSILALDRSLNSIYIEGGVFGYESLIGVNHLLYMAGFYPEDSTRILEFTDLGSGYATNIYTALRRYINDFGYLGMIIVQFIFGVVFSAMYLIIKNSKTVNYFYVFYSIMFMILVYQAIDDQFLVSFLSITQVFTVIFSYIIYRVICRKSVTHSKLNY